MILPPSNPPDLSDVARHYDDLDPYYRELWGEHVHHGLWERGDESAAEAVEALVCRVAREAAIGPGTEVCDVGSGYGATARLLARGLGARVTSITLSPVQHRVALERNADPLSGPPPRYLLGDWLDSALAERSFDAVLAIESTEHMADLGRALAEVCRVLRPGGHFATCVWLAREGAGSLERRWLLEPICREGRLVRLATAAEFTAALAGAGLEPLGWQDLSRRVRRTWSVCIVRVLRRIARDPEARRFLLNPAQPERVFARALLRIWAAYRTGSLRYGLFTARARRR
jgi:tocopherol O-methyltransferase